MIALYVILFISLYASIFFLYSYFTHKSAFKTRIDPTFTPEVTVLIPAYNEEATLARTLDYVFRMTYPSNKLKVLVVDDGSTDRTYEIAKGYVADREGVAVKVLHKENQGCKAYPLNFGLKHVRTDYVFVLDADCMPAKDCLLKLVQPMKDEKTMASITQIKMYRPRGFLASLQEIEFAISAFIRKNLTFINALNITPGGALFKREFFKKHGNYDTTSIVEDFEMGMRVKAKGYDVAHVIDSYIMTYPHRKIRALARERLRWAYGYFTVFKKYGYMFGLRHGDMGAFYLPMSVFFMLVPIVMAGRALLLAFQEGSLRGGMWSGVGYDYAYSIANYEFVLPFKFVYFLMAALLILGLVGFLIALRLSNLRKRLAVTYAFYIVIYLFMLGVINSAAVVMFVCGIKPKWVVRRQIQT